MATITPSPLSPGLSPLLKGSLSIAFAAGLWGLYWIPLRALDEAGIGPLWAAALTMAMAWPFAALAAWRLSSRPVRGDLPWIALFGAGIGISAPLYFFAVTNTDVIRAIFLFYMLPIWTTLIDRLVFGIRLDIARAFAVIIAFAGLWLLLGGDGGIPLPRNAGDWSAIGAGLCWGMTLSLVRARPSIDPHLSTLSAITGAVVMSVIAALFAGSALPPASTFSPGLLAALVAFSALGMWPSMIGQLWGARLVPATRAALLTMSELLVATVSAAALIGTSLTSVQFIGGLVIIAAVLVEVLGAKESP
jgi:drug/metabolite transporter (DMT)-like permease